MIRAVRTGKAVAVLVGGRRRIRVIPSALDALDLVGLLIDGVHIGEHCIVLALGIDRTGRKHALGLWEVPPRMRPSVRASWPTSRAAACAQTAVFWSSLMARRHCTRR